MDMEFKFDVKKVFMTGFAERHFSGKSGVTQIRDMSSEEFIDKVNFELSIEENELDPLPTKMPLVIEGSFPFSRIIKLSNFTTARTTVMEITLENAQYLRTDYSSRTKDELPVMSRWFELPPMIKPSVASNLSVVLYSRDQLVKEAISKATDEEKLIAEKALSNDILIQGLNELSHLSEAKAKSVFDQDYVKASTIRDKEKDLLGEMHLDELSPELRDELLSMTAPWGIVAIMAHDTKDPEPMSPITIMRNALGKEEGGNGTKLNKETYKESVEFWRTHANVK